MTRILLGVVIILLTGCATQPSRSVQPMPAGFDALESATNLIARGQPAEAVRLHLAPLTRDCVEQYENSEQRLYAAGSPAETIMYLVLSAAESDGRSAAAIRTPCADAHYLYGYASIEMGDLDAAERELTRAVAWSPRNSQYISELGHLYHVREDWDAALETFNDAVDAASMSPEAVRESERARALRGAGYSLIELGRLDEAESKFRECLDIDPSDQMAASELEYIQQQRNRQ